MTVRARAASSASRRASAPVAAALTPLRCETRASGDVGSVYYGANHPMKPHRMVMAHHLVLAYDLHKRMEIYVRAPAALRTTQP